MSNLKKLTKCSFCKYKTPSGCAVKPDSYYCREAQAEFYAHLATTTKKTPGQFRSTKRF